jgi:hypothetical protein
VILVSTLIKLNPCCTAEDISSSQATGQTRAEPVIGCMYCNSVMTTRTRADLFAALRIYHYQVQDHRRDRGPAVRPEEGPRGLLLRDRRLSASGYKNRY